MSDWQPISRSRTRYYAVQRPFQITHSDEPPRLEPFPVVAEHYERGYINGVLYGRRVVDGKVIDQERIG